MAAVAHRADHGAVGVRDLGPERGARAPAEHRRVGVVEERAGARGARLRGVEDDLGDDDVLGVEHVAEALRDPRVVERRRVPRSLAGHPPRLVAPFVRGRPPAAPGRDGGLVEANPLQLRRQGPQGAAGVPGEADVAREAANGIVRVEGLVVDLDDHGVAGRLGAGREPRRVRFDREDDVRFAGEGPR